MVVVRRSNVLVHCTLGRSRAGTSCLDEYDGTVTQIYEWRGDTGANPGRKHAFCSIPVSIPARNHLGELVVLVVQHTRL